MFTALREGHLSQKRFVNLTHFSDATLISVHESVIVISRKLFLEKKLKKTSVFGGGRYETAKLK